MRMLSEGSRMLWVANSTPMVALEDSEKVFCEKRFRSWDFPTPESPINTSCCSFKVVNWGGRRGGEVRGRE